MAHARQRARRGDSMTSRQPIVGCDSRQIRTTHANPSKNKTSSILKIQSSWFKSGSGAPAFLSRPYQEVLTREARATIDDVWGVDAVVFNYTFD